MNNNHNYIPQIDSLRAIAVMSVILFHANIDFYNIDFKGGYVGVDIFFVISGYLITKLIILEQKQNKFSFTNFYLRRIRRIMPALFTVAFFSYPFALFFFLPTQLLEFIRSLFSGIFFSSNFFFYFSEIDYYSLPSIYKPLLHYWSLSVEEQFYFVYPISLFLIYKFFEKKLTLVFIIIGILSFAFSIFLSNYDHSLNFYLFPTRIWEFLVGAFAAKIHLQNFDIKNHKLKFFIQIIGLVLIFFSIFYFEEFNNENTNLLRNILFSHPGFATLLPVGGTFFIILFIKEKNFLNKILSFKPIVFIGLISFSLYLWHYPVFSFVRLSSFDLDTYFEYIILILFIFFLSILSFYLVEQPFRKKNKISSKNLFFFLISIIVVLFLFSFHAYKNDGYSTIIPEHFKEFKISDKTKNFLFPKKILKSKSNHSNQNFRAYNNNLDTFLLIGDSHASMFANQIKKELMNRKIDLVNIGHSNIFSLDLISVEGNEMNDLSKKIDKALLEKKISTVILISRIPLYWHKSGFDNEQGADGIEIIKSFTYFLDENKNRLKENDRKKIIADSFNKNILKLLKKDLNVIVFYPVPEAGFWVPNVLASRVLPRLKIKSLFKNFVFDESIFELPEEKYVTTSYDLFLDRNKEVFQMLDRINHPNLYRIYPHYKLCNYQIVNKCITHTHNQIYYRDDDHLSKSGVNLIMPEFIDLLNIIK